MSVGSRIRRDGIGKQGKGDFGFCLMVFGITLIAPSGTACMPQRIVIDSRVSTADALPAWADLGLCLRQCVRGGRVDYASLAEDHRSLDAALAILSRSGPASAPRHYPDRASHLAFWINAHNAAVLRAVVQQVPPPRNGMVMIPDRPPRDPRYGYAFLLDGRFLSAADARSEALRLAGDDVRVRFALCGGRMDGPSLLDQPFAANALDTQLNEAFSRALASEQIVRIDHGDQRLLIAPDLAAVRDRLVTDFRRRTGMAEASLFNVLLEFAAPRRRLELNTAIGYRIETMPPDNRLNLAPATGRN